MQPPTTCPSCGSLLAEDRGRVICPACLLLAALQPDSSTEISTEVPREALGTMIGRYKLLQEIGEGGFGIVYMAEQTEPVKRRVALKVIKLGMDTREVVARFEAERQALAMMEHPHIATVFDGGSTATGRPYFVMELVKGMPITTYCDTHRLATRERLMLFMEVCHAVQHAHQKGVIHRDLKPSNILVTVMDDRAVPKVIDFGIAKATRIELTGKTLFTRLNQWIGTPEYMSPEQAGLGSLDVDTRSDIYSLGVLLYELLTGRPPFCPADLLAAGYDAVMRMIREEEPPKPSTRLSTMSEEERNAVAAKRGAQPATLNRMVRGDLDWIVMKAMEKDRRRRYETPNGLAADLQRHLDNEPILARPPSAVYQMQTAWRRHKVSFTVAAMLTGSLILGLGMSTWQAVEARRARTVAARAQAVAEKENAGRKRQLREAARTDRLMAMELIQQDRDADAFAHLARACEYDPESNLAAATAILRLNVLNVARQVAILHGTSEFPLEPIDRHESIRRNSTGEDEEMMDAAFTPDGRQILTRTVAQGGSAQLWNADTGRKLRDIPENISKDDQTPRWNNLPGLQVDGTFVPFNPPWEVKVRDDGPIPSPDGTTELRWEPHGLILRRKSLSGHEVLLATRPDGSENFPARFSPDGLRVARASADHRVVFHHSRSGEVTGLCPGHAGAVNRIRFRPDASMMVTASADTTARVWETADRRLLQRFAGPGLDRLFSLVFSLDDRWLLGETLNNRLLVWDALTGELSHDLPHMTGAGERVATSPDATLAVLRESPAGKAGAIRLWDTVNRSERMRLGNQDLALEHAAFSPDNRLLATHELDGTVRLWQVADGRQISETPTPVVDVTLLGFSPDSQFLVVGSNSGDHADRPSVLIESGTGRILAKLIMDLADLISASFHPSGKFLATGSNDAKIRIWECSSGRLLNTLSDLPQTVASVEFSPDGKRMATAYWRSTIVHIWDTEDWRLITRIRNPPYHLVENFVFSPDSRMLVALSDRADELVVWDARTGETLARLAIPDGDYSDAAFSHDGKRLVTLSRNASESHLSGGPVMLELPDLTEPVPSWFPDFLRFLLQRTIDGGGRRRVLTPTEWESLRDRVTAAAIVDPSRYGELARWFLAPDDQRPVRPGETMTRHALADRWVTPDADLVQLEQSLALDPAQPLAHLAIARFAPTPVARQYLRQWAAERLPAQPDPALRQRIESIETGLDRGDASAPGTTDHEAVPPP